METLVSPRMLPCSLGRSCLIPFALSFLTVLNVWVKGSRVSPSFASCHPPKSNTLSDTYSSLFLIVFSIRVPRYFQEFGKKHPQALIHLGRCVIFNKKVQNFDYTVHRPLKINNTCPFFSLSYVHPCLALAPRKLRTHGKSVESRTRTVSSCVTID